MNCGKCHHFSRFEHGHPQGACTAHPPTASIIMVPSGAPAGFEPQNFTAFPTLSETQSCGEFTLSAPRLVLPN